MTKTERGHRKHKENCAAGLSEEWQHSPLDVLPSAAAGFTCGGDLGSAAAVFFLLLRILFALGSLTAMRITRSKPGII